MRIIANLGYVELVQHSILTIIIASSKPKGKSTDRSNPAAAAADLWKAQQQAIPDSIQLKLLTANGRADLSLPYPQLLEADNESADSSDDEAPVQAPVSSYLGPH